MKLFHFLILIFAATFPCLAEDYLIRDGFAIMGEWKRINGSWTIKNGVLVQEDTADTMTHSARMVKQEGIMEYEFDCFYRGGLSDRYGGFGIHICIDSPTSGRSWGMGRSFLLWMTFDPKAYGRDDCFFLQVYRSTSPVHMDFLHNKKGDEYPLDPDILSPEDFTATGRDNDHLRFRIRIDCTNGKGRFYHPRKPEYYYPFDLDTVIQPGMYISFRTNSLSIGIDEVIVRAIE
ncbi:MAG: hypothetical protein JW881_14255 [Spirochaetales bacterium]|nr:hypothetical protein [Spirochaetales bacterium]